MFHLPIRRINGSSPAQFSLWRFKARARAGQAGFTLIELVMVMTILVILASIGVVNYQKIQQRARETQLKDDLKTMRKLLDQYTADKEQPPQQLDDLVSAGYMREVPVDPVTGETDWQVEMGDNPLGRGDTSGEQGIIDVHSKAGGTDLGGKPYAEY